MFDKILFDDSIIKPYNIKRISSAAAPYVDLKNGIISYFSDCENFWKLIYSDEEVWSEHFLKKALVKHYNDCFGFKEKADDLLISDVPDFYFNRFSKNNHSSYNKEDTKLLIGSLLFPWKYLYYDRIFTANELIDGGVSVSSKAKFENIKSLLMELKLIAIDYLWKISEVYRNKTAVKSAIAAIMSRNMSHNLGSHVVTNAKHQITELEQRQEDNSVKVQLKGISALLQYLQERQDFIAVIANDEHYPKGPLNFKSAVFDLLAMDGPGRRHSPDNKDNQINNYILDNIVRSEDIVRDGSLADQGKLEGALKIELELVKIDGTGCATTFKSLDEQHEIGNEFADFTLSVNNGLNGRQAFLTIIENIIRNAAKHNRDALQNLENNTLLFSIIFKEVNNCYEITICSNKREFATVKEFFETNGIISSQDGRLAPLQILREDGGGIARENKGIKEMLISLAWLKYGETLDSAPDASSSSSKKQGKSVTTHFRIRRGN